MLTPFENFRERGDYRRYQLSNPRGALYIAGFMQIFIIDEPQEFGMLTIIIPDEVRQLRDGFDGRNPIEVQRLFSVGECSECMFEHSREQLLLAAEIIVEHSLVGFGTACNLVNTRAEQAARSKFLCGGEQDATACTLGISFDFWLVHGGFVIDKPRYRAASRVPVSSGSMRWIGYANVIGGYRPAVNQI